MDIRRQSKILRTAIGFVGVALLQLNCALVNAADDFPLSVFDTVPGTHIITAGIGLESTPPDTITFSIPAGASVEQVLLYWEGYMDSSTPPGNPGDNQITVNSNDVVGELIGGPVVLGGSNQYSSYAYRADITSLGLVSAGSNNLTITNMDFDDVNDGAGVLVIIHDGSDLAEISVREGNDYAYSGATGDLQVTVAQVFYFTPSIDERTANLELFFASVYGAFSGGGDRPTAIEVTVGANPPLVYNNLLDSVDGDEWDTISLPITVPANEDQLKVQAFSEDRVPTNNNPASFHWLTAGLAITPPPPPGGEGCTPGFWKNTEKHLPAWVGYYTPTTPFSDVFENAFPGLDLAQVLRAKGGGLNALGRHTVAALLNGANSDISYGMTDADVIAAFNAVYPGSKNEYTELKNEFAAANESGCPINGKTAPAD
jgi:hypothetical protein